MRFAFRDTVRYFRDKTVPAFHKALAALAVVYVVSPIDLIPDVPIVGWLDDMGVIAAMVAYYARQISAYSAARQEKEINPRPPTNTDEH